MVRLINQLWVTLILLQLVACNQGVDTVTGIIGVITAICIIILIGCIIRACYKRCNNPNTDPLQDPDLQIVSSQTVSATNLQNNCLSTTPQASNNLGRGEERAKSMSLTGELDPESVCTLCLEWGCNVKTICNHSLHSRCLTTQLDQKLACPECRSALGYVCLFCSTCHKYNQNFNVTIGSTLPDSVTCNSCLSVSLQQNI